MFRLSLRANQKRKKTIKALTQAEPIVNVSDHQISYSGGAFPSMASVGGKLYVAIKPALGTTVNLRCSQITAAKEVARHLHHLLTATDTVDRVL